jgi:hypothetical protein
MRQQPVVRNVAAVVGGIAAAVAGFITFVVVASYECEEGVPRYGEPPESFGCRHEQALYWLEFGLVVVAFGAPIAGAALAASRGERRWLVVGVVLAVLSVVGAILLRDGQPHPII